MCPPCNPLFFLLLSAIGFCSAVRLGLVSCPLRPDGLMDAAKSRPWPMKSTLHPITYDCGLYPDYTLLKTLANGSFEAIVGVMTPKQCDAVSTIAGIYDRQVVVAGCAQSSAERLPTSSIIYSDPSVLDVAEVVARVVDSVPWKFSAVVGATGSYWKSIINALEESFRKNGHMVLQTVILDDDTSRDKVEHVLNVIIQPIKLVILCMDVGSLLLDKILFTIRDLEFDDGRLALLLVQPYPIYGFYTLFASHPTETLRSLFVVTASESPFDPKSVNLSKAGLNTWSPLHLYVYSRYYDAISLAISLTTTSTTNENSSETGYEVSFQTISGLGKTDPDGNRKFSFLLMDMNVRRDTFKVLLILNGSGDESALSSDWLDAVDWPRNKPLEADDSCLIPQKECSLKLRKRNNHDKDSIFVGIGLLLFFVVCSIAAFVIKKQIHDRQMNKRVLLTTQDLQLTKKKQPTLSRLSQESLNCAESGVDGRVSANTSETTTDETLFKMNSDFVFVRVLTVMPPFRVRKKAVRHLQLMQDLRQENINTFLGCYVDPIRPSLVWEHGCHGSLDEVIRKETARMDWAFKLSLMTDLSRGIRFIHNSQLKVHGRLTTRNCVVDSRWVLKVTDYGLHEFYQMQGISFRPPEKHALLFRAPEVLRCENMQFAPRNKTSDIYSMAVILQEIITQTAPFSMLDLPIDEIVDKLISPPPIIRPTISSRAAPDDLILLVKQCWSEQEHLRPDSNHVYEQFWTFNRGKKSNIVDNMFKQMVKHTANLEDKIRQRTEHLDNSKKQTDSLLNKMLPAAVAETLIAGGKVEPERFNDVTVYFSDIVGYTAISAYSDPFDVVNLLNDLYTAFDVIIENHNVYKVETIGDAYMVAGGVPAATEDHAEQVAHMALELLACCNKFVIRHMPSVPLLLRIGIHTGPLVAGVVGHTMPRYCLFGDTVNTASRMESTSQANRIHISHVTEEKLRKTGRYSTQFRGNIELKGKGTRPTYWLLGMEGFEKDLPSTLFDSQTEMDVMRLIEQHQGRTTSDSSILDAQDDVLRNGFANYMPSVEVNPLISQWALPVESTMSGSSPRPLSVAVNAGNRCQKDQLARANIVCKNVKPLNDA